MPSPCFKGKTTKLGRNTEIQNKCNSRFQKLNSFLTVNYKDDMPCSIFTHAKRNHIAGPVLEFLHLVEISAVK